MFFKEIGNHLKLRKITRALSNPDSFVFFKSQGFEILSNFKEGEVILELLKEGLDKRAYSKLESFAFALSIEIGGRYFGEQKHFEVPEVYKQFRDYMYYDKEEISLVLICSKKESNERIKRECLEILKVLLEEKRLGDFQEDVRYIEWHTEVMRKSEEE